MLKALQLFGLKGSEAISFGDRAVDIESSKKAGINSVACTWGSNEYQILMNAKPTYVINEPQDIIQFLR